MTDDKEIDGFVYDSENDIYFYDPDKLVEEMGTYKEVDSDVR